MRIIHALITLTRSALISLLVVACSSLPTRNYQLFSTFHDTLKNGEIGPALVVIPAGHFIMGPVSPHKPMFPAELPAHEVTIAHAFAIGQYELTFREYDEFVTATGYEKPSDRGWGSKHWGRNRTPVFNVSWQDAQRYLEWLSDQTGARYRLPSEAEWEYAARAGTTTEFNTGDCIDTDRANFHGKEALGQCKPSGQYRGQVIETGRFEPNAWQLYDMHGNILEWTQDCWHDSYQDAPADGTAWLDENNANCQRRVLRGGSWSGRAVELRSAARTSNEKDFRSIFIGFRVVRELD